MSEEKLSFEVGKEHLYEETRTVGISLAEYRDLMECKARLNAAAAILDEIYTMDAYKFECILEKIIGVKKE